MGVFSKIVSTTKEIKQIRTFVEGAAKDIHSIWTFIEGERHLVFPSNGVLLNLSGASKYEEDTVFVPGRYKIELAPGTSKTSLIDAPQTRVSNMVHIEEITQPFIIRAYCGSNATTGGIGINPYSGAFKVNGITSTTAANGEDVTHIFGAGGGNGQTYQQYFPNTINGGGGNCLGNGSISSGMGENVYGGAGSCLHILPVGGTFGTDYIRAYQASGHCSIPGGAYGGGGGGTGTNYAGGYASRGGNSPYGNGGTPVAVSSGVPNTSCTAGTGVGAGGKTVTGTWAGGSGTFPVGAGAYFNGTTWIDEPGNLTNTGSSYIRITFLGALD